MQELLDVTPCSSITELVELYIFACKQGHIDVIKWLMTVSPDIHLSPEIGIQAIQSACMPGHLHIVQWLMCVNALTNVDEVIRMCCLHGHLHIIQWLIGVIPTVDISKNNNFAFRVAFEHGHLNIVQWIYSVSNELQTFFRETTEAQEVQDEEDESHDESQDESQDKAQLKCNHLFWDRCIEVCVCVCLRGASHLEVVKWLFSMNPLAVTRMILTMNVKTFFIVCSRGYLDVAQWLHAINPRIHIRHPQGHASEFAYVCLAGHLEVAKWLTSLFDEQQYANMFKEFEQSFLFACQHGKLDVAQWLFSTHCLEHDMTVCIYEAFRHSCAYGFLDVAKWLQSLKPDIVSVSGVAEDAFRRSCEHGKLLVAKWLFSLKPSLSTCCNMQEAFRNIKWNGYLDMFKWLIEVTHCVNEDKFFADNMFDIACQRNNLLTAHAMQLENPFLYKVEFSLFGKIGKYNVRRREEVRWQQRKYVMSMRSGIGVDVLNKNTNLFHQLPKEWSKYIVHVFL